MAKKKRTLKYYVVDSSVVDFSQLSKSQDIRGVRIEKHYLNYTRDNIVVVDRMGFQNTIESAVKSSLGKFIIRTTYRFGKGADRAYANKFFKNINIQEGQYPQLGVLKESFLQQEELDMADDRRTGTGFRLNSDTIIVLDSVYREEDIFRNDIYAVDHDVVITKRAILDENIEHPFNTLKTVEMKHEAMMKDHQGIGINIELIDNENLIGDRFFFAGGKVMRIQPARNIEREDGIYFTLTEQGITGSETTTTRYEFGDAEKDIGLWPTQEEAESAGDIKALNAKEIARLNLEAQLASHAHRIEIDNLTKIAKEEEAIRKQKILELEERIVERNRELEEARQNYDRQLAEEKQRYEEKRMRDQDHYERKSYERKDTHEFVKIAGAVIGATLTIWALLAKSK